jgi:hypothetical protein
MHPRLERPSPHSLSLRHDDRQLRSASILVGRYGGMFPDTTNNFCSLDTCAANEVALTLEVSRPGIRHCHMYPGTCSEVSI